MSPARYFPIESGRYEVKPGLFKFGTDFGNGDADRQVFQIDDQFPRYLAVKMAARQERLSKYFQTHDYQEKTAEVIEKFIVGATRRVARRDVETQDDGRASGSPLPNPDLDALACKIQEDLAVIQRDGDRHWLAAIHLCFPNHWAAEEKIGKTFAEIHAPVAGIEPINRQADKMVDVMINATQGYVRFVWGIATDTELNHHPGNPRGRNFDPKDPHAFLRIERQTIWGFPEVEASLFTIRTYFEDLATLERDKRAKVISAIESMTPASLAYKGLAESRDDFPSAAFPMNEIITIAKLSNREFLEKHAQPGRVGLVGGTTLIEKVIKRAERHVHPEEEWSLWSHALVFEGQRVDGCHWVIESDLDIHHKHIRLGVQENRVDKYFNEKMFPTIAVLDFGLTEEQTGIVLREALEMVANRMRYSLRELFGTMVALRHPKFRPKTNLLAREKSMYCSGFVQYVFQKAGIDLVPGVHPSHNSPEDISRTPVPHKTYLLRRP